jgi:16S rRNA (cytosine1402-N4)-methyltransferase
MHTPVLLPEVLVALGAHIGGRQYIDCTGGEGGYTQALLDLGNTTLTLDADNIQAEHLTKHFNNTKANIVHANYKDVENIAQAHNYIPCDGVVFDLGLSFKQMIENGRGLSFKILDDTLDMRLNENDGVSAEEIINTYSEEMLKDMLIYNAEEIQAEALAKAISTYRRKYSIATVADLLSAVETVTTNTSTLARIFQALRIEANNEFAYLKEGLLGAMKCIKKEGIVVVVSFHSKEDRIVKQFAQAQGYKLKKVSVKRERAKFEKSAVIKVISFT